MWCSWKVIYILIALLFILMKSIHMDIKRNLWIKKWHSSILLCSQWGNGKEEDLQQMRVVLRVAQSEWHQCHLEVRQKGSAPDLLSYELMTYSLILVSTAIIKKIRNNNIFQCVGSVQIPKQDNKNETLAICIVLRGINNLYLKEGLELATTNE